MISITFHPNFKKSYQKRIAPQPKLVKQVKQRIALFQNDQGHPLLRNHQLIGKKNIIRAFSITGDIRIIYEYLTSNSVIFLDIGSHNQVY